MKPVKIFLANVGFRRLMHPLVTPPLGIMYLASYLRSKFKTEIQLVNQKVDNIPNDSLVKMAKDFGADVVGLGSLTPYAHYIPDITKNIKRALPGSLVVLGGPNVSAFGADSLKDTEADAAVPGEGEPAFEQILQRRLDRESFKDVPGIFWRDKKKNIITNPGRLPFIEDLDALPFPAYDLIDLPSHWPHQSMTSVPKRKYATLFSSRGCPYNCIYCHCVFGKKHRLHSAERIVDEIQHYQKQYGINDFEFVEDIFNLNRKRLMEFCALVHKRNLKIKISFPNAVRTDILKEDELDALVDTGLYFSSFALESGSPRIQKLMRKNLKIPEFLKNVELAASKGVFTYGFVMFGFPTETEEDMQMTVDAVLKSKLHTASFFTVTPFPNTELYEMAKKTHAEELKKLDYRNMEYTLVSINLSNVSDERLLYYQRKVNRKFFFNPVRIFRILRDFPKPLMLLLYLPEILRRATRGITSKLIKSK